LPEHPLASPRTASLGAPTSPSDDGFSVGGGRAQTDVAQARRRAPERRRLRFSCFSFGRVFARDWDNTNNVAKTTVVGQLTSRMPRFC